MKKNSKKSSRLPDFWDKAWPFRYWLISWLGFHWHSWGFIFQLQDNACLHVEWPLWFPGNHGRTGNARGFGRIYVSERNNLPREGTWEYFISYGKCDCLQGWVSCIEGEPGAYYQSSDPCPRCYGIRRKQ